MRRATEERWIMIEGFSINGPWPTGLLVTWAVALFTIPVVCLGGRASSAHPGSTPTRAGAKRDVGSGGGTSVPSGPGGTRQLLDEGSTRADLTTEGYQDRIRVLGEGT